MENQKPLVSFSFPLRWIKNKKDRPFLAKNIDKMVKRELGNVLFDARIRSLAVAAFFIRINIHAYQPVVVPLKKDEVKKIFEPIFPGANLVGYEKFFVQKKKSTALPVLEMQVYKM